MPPAAPALAIPDAGRYAPAVDLTDPSTDPLAALLEDAIGRFAVCGIGLVGVITGRAWTSYGRWAWVGRSMTNQPWSSTQPIFLHPAQNETFRAVFAAAHVTMPDRISAGRIVREQHRTLAFRVYRGQQSGAYVVTGARDYAEARTTVERQVGPEWMVADDHHRPVLLTLIPAPPKAAP